MSIFLSRREKEFIDSITKELINDVIGQSIILFKVNGDYTNEDNIYGESSNKIFYPGVQFNSLIEELDPDIVTSERGLSQNREIELFAQKENLSDLDVFPEEGDFLYWDEQFFEITKVFQLKNLQGIPTKKITIKIEAKSADVSTVTVGITTTATYLILENDAINYIVLGD